jgi:hypothetical protein
LNEDILVRDLLCLRNQTLLQTLDLLDKLIGLWVCALQLAPSVNIQGLLKLISEELSLLLLFKILLLKKEYLSAEIWNTSSLVLGYDQKSLELSNLVLDSNDFFNLLLIVNLTFVKC